MNETSPSRHQPYEWGKDAFSLPRSSRRPTKQESETNDSLYKARVGHPNVVNDMTTIDGHVRNDDHNRGSAHSRSNIRQADETGWSQRLSPPEVDAINTELRRDEEERNLTVESLGHLATAKAAAESKKEGLFRGGKRAQELRYINSDESYLRERLDRLSRDGQWSEPGEGADASLEWQNVAWGETTDNFLRAPAGDGTRNIDILHEQALSMAKSSDPEPEKKDKE